MRRAPHGDRGTVPAGGTVGATSSSQTTASVLMLRPASFGANQETRASNAFQGATSTPPDAAGRALTEFDGLVAALRAHGVEAHVVDDTPEPAKPDAVFPNNWVSFHPEGVAVLYPMHAPNRRAEVRAEILDELAGRGARETLTVVDLRAYAGAGLFLEGTGSLVLDRIGGVAYACRSPRTSERLVGIVCAELGLRPVLFTATDAQGRAIYHTNVMLSVGTDVAVVCLESVEDAEERATLERELRAGGRELVEITREQMGEFAGNVLELRGGDGRALFVMSERARSSLRGDQLAVLERHGGIVSSDLGTIETLGGGSARCMIAELF